MRSTHLFFFMLAKTADYHHQSSSYSTPTAMTGDVLNLEKFKKVNKQLKCWIKLVRHPVVHEFLNMRQLAECLVLKLKCSNHL